MSMCDYLHIIRGATSASLSLSRVRCRVTLSKRMRYRVAVKRGSTLSGFKRARCFRQRVYMSAKEPMGWLRLVGSSKLEASFAE